MSAWTMMPPRFRWAAGADRLAHAVPVWGRVTRTACGLEPAGLRIVRSGRRCPRCLAVLGFPPEPATPTMGPRR